MLFEVTSRPLWRPGAALIDDTAFASGTLRVTMYTRPGKLFTASRNLMTGEVGLLTPERERVDR